MRGVTVPEMDGGNGGEGGRSAGGGSQRCNIRTMIIIQNRRQNPLRGVFATRRRRSSPRTGGSICCLQRALTPRVASDIRTDLPHRSTSGLSNGRRIRSPYYARAGIGMGRASGVWEACRSTEQLLLILRRLARLFAVERSIYSDLQ